MDIINNTNKEKTETIIPEDAPIVVALDIGTTKIVTLVGIKNNNNKIEILAYANVPSKGILRGAVANIKDATESIGRSVKEAAAKCNVQIAEVVVGVAGQFIKSFNQSTSLTISASEVSENDIYKMIEDIKQISQKPGEKIISIIPQDFSIDDVIGIIDPPIGYSGKHIKGNFHVVSVSESIIQNISRCVEANKMSVQEFFLEPIASAAAVLTDEQKEAGACLIDIGGGTTDIAIYHENIIRHSAVIPIGGNIITKDIKEVCKITEKEAEKLKIDHGSAMPFDELKSKNLRLIKPGENFLGGSQQIKTINAYHLSEIINARAEEIVKFIDLELDKSGYKEKLSTGIILTGGGSLLKNIQSVFMSHIGINTNIGIPNQHISTSIEELKTPVYSTAIGLLMLGFDNLSQKTNNESDQSKSEKTKHPTADGMDIRKKKFLEEFFKGIKGIFFVPENS